MRLALASPIVTLNPGTHAAWEDHGTIDDLATVAEAADRLGYHHLTCSEHIGLPATELERRGARYWDPLATFGYLAARTTQIRFATHVLVLGYHHPLEIAKRYGTLDVVSGGRLTLGVGVGSLEAEFDLIGAPFDDRGSRGDDALRALRASLSQREPEYHGEHYDFSGFVIDPTAVQAHVPIWVGGRTRRSLRRAVTLGDGWNPFAVRATEAKEWLAKIDVPQGFEVILPAVKRVDPIDEPDQTQEILAETAACGATITYATFRHEARSDYLEKLEALANLHTAMGDSNG
ncbi:MAG: putative F420-dependent oxidoreductase [Candidatus Aldehydirespiratoraceae bacterium]|jgi:probable F420-dependent oxidoreductase